MISAKNVSKNYGDFAALDDVSIDVAEGALTALLGPSGSGKSTLLRVISGLEVPDTGTVILGGEDVTRVPPQERGVGFVFQHYAAFKHRSVPDNVAIEVPQDREGVWLVVPADGVEVEDPRHLRFARVRERRR